MGHEVGGSGRSGGSRRHSCRRRCRGSRRPADGRAARPSPRRDSRRPAAASARLRPGQIIAMGGIGSPAPGRPRRAAPARPARRQSGVGEAWIARCGPVDPAQFLGARMDVDQLGLRATGISSSAIALRRDFAEPAADQTSRSAALTRATSFGLGAKPEVAGIERVQRIEQRRAAIAGRRPAMSNRSAKTRDLPRAPPRPSALPPSTNIGRFGLRQQFARALAMSSARRRGLDRLEGRRVGDADRARSACPWAGR